MQMDEAEIIKQLILQKLIRSNTWGGKHSPRDFIMKGLPEQYRNQHKGRKAIEKAIKELTNNEWVFMITKKTGKGSDTHVSLNPRKVREIQQFLEQVQ